MMASITAVLTLSLLVTTFQKAAAQIEQKKFESADQQTITYMDNLISSTTTRSRLECASKCHSTNLCVTFTFVGNTSSNVSSAGACNLHCRVMARQNLLPAPPGEKTFTVKRGPVSCGQTDENGWILIQRRSDGSVKFDRDWLSYEAGFGLDKGECWLGLRNIRTLTTNGNWTLRIEMGGWECNEAYASYTGFSLSSSTYGYQLVFDAGSYAGTAGDSLSAHRGRKFSTADADYDSSSGNCAELLTSGWWFGNCFNANLNGVYTPNSTSNSGVGIIWVTWKGVYSLKYTEMKIKLNG